MSPKCSHQEELRPKSSTALSNTREHGREGQKAVNEAMNEAADVREHSRGRLVVREHVRRRQDVPAGRWTTLTTESAAESNQFNIIA